MLTRAEVLRIACALVIASALGRRGLKKGSLTQKGAAAAFLVGFLSLCAGYRFGFTLISFYLIGTRATRFRAARKRIVEDGVTLANGNRGASQVLGSSAPGVLFAIAYALVFRDDMPLSTLYPDRTALQLSYLLFFTACAGDTLSSEIGSVFGSPEQRPVLLVAPWRKVPIGTNGGVSLAGTVSSVIGGVLVAAVFFVTGPAWTMVQMRLVAVGAVGGFLGSALDSVLGSLVQASYYDPETEKVFKEAPVPDSLLAKRAVHITGVNLLSGEAVNGVSALLTCAIAPLLVPWFAGEEIL